MRPDLVPEFWIDAVTPEADRSSVVVDKVKVVESDRDGSVKFVLRGSAKRRVWA